MQVLETVLIYLKAGTRHPESRIFTFNQHFQKICMRSDLLLLL